MALIWAIGISSVPIQIHFLQSEASKEVPITVPPRVAPSISTLEVSLQGTREVEEDPLAVVQEAILLTILKELGDMEEAEVVDHHPVVVAVAAVVAEDHLVDRRLAACPLGATRFLLKA